MIFRCHLSSLRCVWRPSVGVKRHCATKFPSFNTFKYLGKTQPVPKQCRLLHELNSKSQGHDKSLPKWVKPWLLGCAASVFTIVVIGGITRLTESGLSITEWKPVTGVLPPLSEDAWRIEFEKYKQSPEFKMLNSRMDLNDFKSIFFWEWAHRLLGRCIGVAYVLPASYLLIKYRKQMPRTISNKLYLSAGLLGAQGFVGWWMVKSGLEEERMNDIPRVSAYRLATHLFIAFSIYMNLFSTFYEVHFANSKGAISLMKHPLHPEFVTLKRAIYALWALTLTTAMSGAFVAGLDAGLIYCEFPFMGGPYRLMPSVEEVYDPKIIKDESLRTKWRIFWKNAFENPVAAQFHHRVLAMTTFTATLGVAFYASHGKIVSPTLLRGLRHTSIFVTCQAALGICTLIWMVPVWLGALHQAGSLVLLLGVTMLAKRAGHISRLTSRAVTSVPKQTLQKPLSYLNTNLGSKMDVRYFSHHTYAGRTNYFKRQLATAIALRHGSYPELSPSDKPIRVTFEAPNGEKMTVNCPKNVSILDVAHHHDIDIEGACEGSCACSTCHVILDEEHYGKIPEPSDEENDMLDLAFGLQETSRLGCQIQLNSELDGLLVKLPSATRNMRVDGYKPEHH